MASRLATIRGCLADLKTETGASIIPPDLADVVTGYLLDGIAMAVEWLDACREGDVKSLGWICRVAQPINVPLTPEEYERNIKRYVNRGLAMDERWQRDYRKRKPIDDEMAPMWRIFNTERQRIATHRRDAPYCVPRAVFHLINGWARARISYRVLWDVIQSYRPPAAPAPAADADNPALSFMAARGCAIDQKLVTCSTLITNNPAGWCRDVRLKGVVRKQHRKGQTDPRERRRWKNPEPLNIGTLGTMIAATEVYHHNLAPKANKQEVSR